MGKRDCFGGKNLFDRNHVMIMRDVKNFMMNNTQQLFVPRVWHEFCTISPIDLQLNRIDFQIDLNCNCLDADEFREI